MRNVTFIFAVAAIGVLFTMQPAKADTIHGTCDGLAGHGAAYGLCVAICEVPAQDPDCQPVFIDGVLQPESLDKCRTASRKLVDNYLKHADGEPLPCGDYQDSVSCPCAFADPSEIANVSTYTVTSLPRVVVGGTLYDSNTFTYTVQKHFARGKECIVGKGNNALTLPTNDEEFEVCLTEIHAIGALKQP